MIGVLLGTLSVFGALIMFLLTIVDCVFSKKFIWPLLIIGLLAIAIGAWQIREENRIVNINNCNYYVKTGRGKLIGEECYVNIGDDLWMSRNTLDPRFYSNNEINTLEKEAIKP